MSDVSEWWFGFSHATRARLAVDEAKDKLKTLCDWAREFGFDEDEGEGEPEIDDDLREWFECAMGEDEGEEE